MKQDLKISIGLPAGVIAQLDGSLLKIKGPKGEVVRVFSHPKIAIIADKSAVVLQSSKATKREKMMMGSFEAHIQNMIKGVQVPFEYKMKICSGHFPMSVAVSGQEFTVKNFLGESVPRKAILPKGVVVKVNGAEIVLTSSDRELVGQAASKIEELCRITNRDRRIFQDGCYIVDKARA